MVLHEDVESDHVSKTEMHKLGYARFCGASKWGHPHDASDVQAHDALAACQVDRGKGFPSQLELLESSIKTELRLVDHDQLKSLPKNNCSNSLASSAR